MNTQQLKKRYKRSQEEIAGIIQEHLSEWKDHARFDEGEWHLDEEAVHCMDELLGCTNGSPKAEPEPQSADRTPREVSVNEEKEAPADEASLLHAKLEEAERRAENYAAELSALQERFLQIQNGREAMNSSFIKKHQIRAETAEKELKKVQLRSQEDMRRKDERIKELEDRIEDMQGKLIESHSEIEQKQGQINQLSRQIEDIKEEASNRCSKAELRVLESKRSEDKLYKELHDTEAKVSELGQRLSVANDDRSEALRKMAEMKAEFTGIKSKLISITAGLGDYLTELETIPDAGIIKEEGAPAVDAQTAGELPETQLLPSKNEAMPISPAIQDQRQELLDQLKKEQEAARKEPSSGVFRQLLQKAAGFF